jgi:hypothetical protein
LKNVVDLLSVIVLRDQGASEKGAEHERTDEMPSTGREAVRDRPHPMLAHPPGILHLEFKLPHY